MPLTHDGLSEAWGPHDRDSTALKPAWLPKSQMGPMTSMWTIQASSAALQQSPANVPDPLSSQYQVSTPPDATGESGGGGRANPVTWKADNTETSQTG